MKLVLQKGFEEIDQAIMHFYKIYQKKIVPSRANRSEKGLKFCFIIYIGFLWLVDFTGHSYILKHNAS